MSKIHAGRDAINVSAGQDAINICSASNIVINTGDHSRSGAASGSQDVQRDSFQPSFHVPSNPREVVMDFGDPLDHTQPKTQEARVLEEILRDDCNEYGARVIGIHGKGGVGKSCILRALAKNERVKQRFPDGIYFLSLGMDAGTDKLVEGLVEIVLISGGQELGKELRGEGNLQIVLKTVREWLNGKTCLLLADDFWEEKEENGLGANVVTELTENLSGRSMLVLTTRFSAIATKGAEIRIMPLETTSKEAKNMLLRYSKFDLKQLEQENLIPAFDMLLTVCGGLPIFLAIVGKAVAKIALRFTNKSERASAWEECERMMRDSKLLRTNVDGYEGLGRTLHMSLKLLSEACGELFEGLSPYSLAEIHRAFCVFRKQAVIPVSVCRRLWRVESDSAALEIGMAFADVGLADVEIKRMGDRQVAIVRLHDLIQIFAVNCANAAGEVTMWHERLLEGFVSKEGGRESVRRWWDIEEKRGEEYLLGNLCRHLARSGNVKELAGLLLCGEWTKLRHKHGGLSTWKQDCSEYLGRKMVVALSESEKEIESGVRMVRDAVVESWAAVYENPHELGYQMFGRLVDCNNSVVEKYLESIQRVQCGPWLKPMQRYWPRPGEGGMKAEFHLGYGISDIAVQKDPFIAAVAVGKKIDIVDLEEMTVRSICLGHAGDVEKVAMSSDGNRVFSWSKDWTVQWDVQSGKEDTDECVWLEDEESDEDDEVTCVAFCVGKSLVVTGSRKRRVKVWDLNSGERKGSILDVSESVNCIEVSPDGQTIAVGTKGWTILLWDMQTFIQLGGNIPQCKLMYIAGGSFRSLDGVGSMAFSSDGRFAASAYKWIRLWSIENITEAKGPFWDCEYYASCMTFSGNGEQIICGQLDGSIAIHDVTSGAVICSWKAHSHWVRCVAVSSDLGGRCAVITCGGGDNVMRVWDLQETANVTDERIQHKSRIYCVAASPDGQFFVSASEDRTLRIWNAADGTARGGPLCGHEDDVCCVAVSPDSLRLVSGSSDRIVRVWDVATGAQVGKAFQEHKARVSCVAYSKDGRFVVSGSHDCTVRVWRVTESPHIDEDVSGPKAKRVIRAEPEAHELLSSREPLCLEMILNHELEDEEDNSERWVTAVSMGPDGQKVLSGLWNAEIWVWDLTFEECVCRKQSHHRSKIVGIEISEDNEVLTSNRYYEELRWRLDDEGGLTRVLKNENESGIAQAEAQERSVSYRISSIVYDEQTVVLTGSEKIAILPEITYPIPWKYDSQRRVLCVGLQDGRVLIFQVQC